jgi:soluble lytic murein transglycosylase-like protein
MSITTLIFALCAIFNTTEDSRIGKHIVKYAPIIYLEALEQGIDPVVVGSVIALESGFNSKALGQEGEIGLMQLHPEGQPRTVCKDLWKTIWDPKSNIKCGVRVLAMAREACPPDTNDFLWLGKYNAPARSCAVTKYARKVWKLFSKTIPVVMENKTY